MVQAHIRDATGCRVIAGPFEGMQLPSDDMQLKYMMGTYEMELHSVLHELLQMPFETVVNVGAGDGYYAVGVARCRPEVRVVAFEMLPAHRSRVKLLARNNGVEDRVVVMGHCMPEHFKQCVTLDPRSLVIMDCEGGEGTLLDPVLVPGLRTCHVLVELHDFMRPGIGDEIWSAFIRSHDIEEIWSRARTFADITIPTNDTDERERQLYVAAIDENRPSQMRWLYMRPRC
jgi:hypothetical protein